MSSDIRNRTFSRGPSAASRRAAPVRVPRTATTSAGRNRRADMRAPPGCVGCVGRTSFPKQVCPTHPTIPTPPGDDLMPRRADRFEDDLHDEDDYDDEDDDDRPR